MTQLTWIYNSILVTELSDMPENAIGFVYVITDINGKKYIGRKTLFSIRKRKFGKKESALITDKRKKLYEMVKKESNWKTYTGSNKDFNEEIENGLEIVKKEILHYGFAKKQISYLETKELFLREVLEPHTEYWNSNINGTYFRKDVNN